MIIYKISNNFDSNIYVGLDTYNDPNYFGSGTYIKRAIKKYGKGKFKKEILDTALTIEELKQKEKIWIEKLNCIVPNGYNISSGGDGSPGWLQNHPNNEEIRKKIGASKIGNKNCIGRVISEETRMLMSLKKKGKTSNRKGHSFSEESKILLRESIRKSKVKKKLSKILTALLTKNGTS